MKVYMVAFAVEVNGERAIIKCDTAVYVSQYDAMACAEHVGERASVIPLPDGAKIVAIAVIPIDVIQPSGKHTSDQFDVQDFPAHGLDD